MSKEYVVISPVRDEGHNLPRTIDSMAAQTVRPRCWVIVDDGSTDATGQIAKGAARVHPWIKVVTRPDRGFRKAGGGVVDAFYDGYALLAGEAWGYVVKLDGDLSFEGRYFEQCLRHFDENPQLGIAGGTICSNVGGLIEVESKVDPKFHVRGATKIYRRQCWQEIGGLIHAPGWDILDEVKANMFGWTTRTFPDARAIQHRPTGAAYGAWNDHVKGGMGNYIAGYHPLYMFLKCVRRMLGKPYAVAGCGLLYGFIKGYVKRVPRVQDEALIRYLREQQINRVLLRKSVWR